MVRRAEPKMLSGHPSEALVLLQPIVNVLSALNNSVFPETVCSINQDIHSE